MLIYLLFVAILSCMSVVGAKSRRQAHLFAQLFFWIQLGFAACTIPQHGTTHLVFFTYDTLGIAYYVLMGVLGLLCCWQSNHYLDRESLRETKIYLLSFIGLNVALTGVYLSNNIVVTWIFLEATTIAAAGLTYHRRSLHSLEATWKYIFVSSVGIAIAYLGILFLSTASHGELSYHALREALSTGQGNLLYLKLAFIFVLVGYSSKFELFPLYTVGIDANHVAPSPASAFLSSAMVGGGFVAIFRLYRLLPPDGALTRWVSHVLLLVGVLSLLMAAVYLGRTRSFKRLGAYSTVENSGLIALGLGIGGIGAWAAVLHSLAHTLIKGGWFLQLSVVGKMYGNYKCPKRGDYFRNDPLGATALLGLFVLLLALPPSILFRTEYLMLSELIASGRGWIAAVAAVLLLAIIYWLCSKILPLFYKGNEKGSTPRSAGRNPLLSLLLIGIVTALFIVGVWQPDPLIALIDSILRP